MKILVFVKQVPDTDEVKLDPKSGRLIRDGVQSMMNPYDACAVSLAVDIKNACGGEVCAISMGPKQAKSVVQEAIAMGCDRGCLLSDRAFGAADTLATGYTLAMAAKKIGGYDLLLFGKTAVDAETAQTGPIVAELLGLPHATLVCDAHVDGGWAVCKRDLGDALQNVKVKLPAVLTVTEKAAAPKWPDMKRIMSITSFPLDVWDAAALGCDASRIGAAGSPSTTAKIFEPERKAGEAKSLGASPDDIARAIADVLETEGLI